MDKEKLNKMLEDQLAKKSDLEFGDYVVYRKLTLDEGEIYTDLVVVDSEKKAEEYMKWMFGPQSSFSLTPSDEREGFIKMEARTYSYGYNLIEHIPMMVFENNLFWRSKFKNVMNRFNSVVDGNKSWCIPLSAFSELIGGPGAKIY